MIKVKKRKILLLPGDGIGSEVINEVKKIINWFNDKKSLDFEIDEDLAGGCSYDKHGSPITDEVFYKALESAVVMLGASYMKYFVAGSALISSGTMYPFALFLLALIFLTEE